MPDSLQKFQQVLLVQQHRVRMCRFHNGISKKVTGMIDPRVCETHGIEASESFADALDEGVLRETEAKLKEEAKTMRESP